MIVFRTSASAVVGYRRLQRCIYLAAALRKDVDILFCVDKDKQTLELLNEKKFRVCLAGGSDIANDENPGAIIFDIQGFSQKDSELLRWATANARRTIQFSDWGQERQPVDFIIDSFSLDPGSEGGTLIEGPDFTVMHHRYRHFNKTRRKYRASIRNMVIDLGETLDYRLFRDVVDIVSRYLKSVKIVPGYVLKKGNKKALKRIYPNIRFAGKTDSYARAYFEADVALVPPGIEAFQAAAVGTPALYLPSDPVAGANARRLENSRLGFDLGVAAAITRSGFKEQLDRLAFATRLEIGGIGKEMVDSMGAHRVIDFFKKNVII